MTSALADEKYLSLTTYKKDGTPKALPIWVVDAGNGTLAFTTASSSYKVKRLNNDPRVVLQPSDSRGNVREGTEAATGSAVVAHGEEFERVRDLVKAKYGLQFRMISLVGSFMRRIGQGSGTDAAVIITLD